MRDPNPLKSVCLVLCCITATSGWAQTGGIHEPVRYVGGESIDLRPHEGRLRYAVGVANYQVMRANRTHPELADGHGWTYNHAPDLAFWKGRFYLEYLSNPVDEHIAPGHTLVATSSDGRNWDRPQVAFPAYEPPAGTAMPKGSSGYMMHQRMGFYIAPDDRLLVLAFYGHAEDPFEKGGIGRVVREAHADGTFGPIYFLRYTSHADWNEANTSFPFYKRSEDKGFVTACDALLKDRLVTLQWWDEDHGLDGFYNIKDAGEALCYYHRKDGNIVALWKWSLGALSFDQGRTFSDPVRLPTITMDGAKIWAQRTDDGRYAMIYNPTVHGEHRYPLVVVGGDDGILFDNMALVHAEVPPRRFFGRWKDFGPQYNRGIAEGNGNPPGEALWDAYSVNKEDLWVSRIPVPLRRTVEGDVEDDFDRQETGGHVDNWNVYSPRWAPVRVIDAPDAQGRCLELRDEEPHDYARALRVFREGTTVSAGCRVYAAPPGGGVLDIEVVDRFGNRPVRLRLDGGMLKAVNGSEEVEVQPLAPGQWHELAVTVDATPFGHYSVLLNGKEVIHQAALAEAVLSVERLSFRTGPFRDQPTRQTVNETPHDPLPGADEKVPPVVFLLDDVWAKTS